MITEAVIKDIEAVIHITHTTIEAIYPHYYPRGAVDFFLSHHNRTAIKRDINGGNVFILRQNGIPAGTVTVNGNELNRLFVLPEFQGKGLGSQLMKFAEKKISENFAEICLSASLPAKEIYLSKGYTPAEYHMIKTDNGDFLCYDVMTKSLR